MPLPYILRKHNAALDVLTKGTLPSETQLEDMSQLRTQAAIALEEWGYSWPAVLDEEYPRPEPSNNGVKYERIVVEYVPNVPHTASVADTRAAISRSSVWRHRMPRQHRCSATL